MALLPETFVRRGPDRCHSLVISSNSNASPINIGSGNEISIRDLAILIKELMGGTFDIVWDTSKANGQPEEYWTLPEQKMNLDSHQRLP